MKVLVPIKISNLELKNRFVMVPTGAELGDFNLKPVEYTMSHIQQKEHV